MSSTLFQIISTDPNCVPDESQRDQAENFLKHHFSTEQITLKIHDEIVFVDQGENFEAVSCNICGKEISTEEWQNKMNIAYQTRFSNLQIETSCHHTTTLNDLIYFWPAGFAKFVISIQDPQKELDKPDLQILQQILNTTLRIVWAHY